MTFPDSVRALVFCVSRCTRKPADTRREVAVLGSSPVTFGTAWPAPGLGPSEALTVIRVPSLAVEPASGDCETTVPSGWSEGAHTRRALKPTWLSARRAACCCWPLRSGTVWLEGGGGGAGGGGGGGGGL